MTAPFGPARFATSAAEIFAVGIDHAEAVAVGPGGELYAGGEAGQVYKVDWDGTVTEVCRVQDGFTLGMTFDQGGGIYTCDLNRRAVMRLTAGGEASVYGGGTAERKMILPNACAFDDSGNLWVSDSGNMGARDGALWVIRPGGTCEVAREDLCAYPNGLAIAPDCSELYVAVTEDGRVVRLPLDHHGGAGEPEVLASFPQHLVDGVWVDGEGGVYVGCYAPNCVYRIGRDRIPELILSDQTGVTLSAPTGGVLAGPNLSFLVSSSFARWHLSRVDIGHRGVLPYFPQWQDGTVH